MKKRNLLVGLFSMLGLVTMGNSMFAQQNIGAACGCPSVANRTTAAITTLGSWTNLPAAAYGKELTSGNITLTCDKIWTLDEKLYIGPGATITIQPGTVIKGSVAPSVAAARALIIERGGKIMAPGTEDCPIVFTADADPMNGSYSVNNKGMWGGVLICGKATNNLTLAANGPFVPGTGGKMAVADGLGVLEGFASSYPQDQFGAAQSTPVGYVQSSYPAATPGNDNDYTFNLSAANGVSGSNVNGQKVITLGAPAPVYVVAGQLVKLGSIELGRVSSVSSASVTLQFNITTLTAAITSNDQISFSGDYTGTGSAYFPTFASTPVSGAPTASNPNAGNPSTSLAFINYVAPPVPAGTAFDDNDNSGVMTYVSIRHSGANLLVGSEINGLTLASVGRGTKIEHIEIVSCADDNIELFGGTVDIKYCTTLFGNDDMYDYDQGWSGRGQFLFGMKAQHPTSGTIISADNDNGFECDSDDNRSYNTPYSIPRIYNATVIGNAKSATTADNSGMSALWAKDFAGGEFYNSIFSNFRQGVNFATTTSPNGVAGSSRGTNLGGDAWHNYLPQVGGVVNETSGNGSERLKIKCNTFVGNSFGVTLGAGTSTPAGSVILAAGNVGYDKFVGVDNNVIIASATGIPGFSSAFEINPTTNAIVTKNDVTPNPALPLGSGCTQAPMDGFFEPANYRGAFSSTAGDNWLSDWSYSQVLGATSGVAACPTDLNGDGITNTADFLIFAPAFGTSCN
jgi:hypothetical protein